MPQHGAHITQTLQAKPSIFEVVAADSLQSTFYPALKRIANVIQIKIIRNSINKIKNRKKLLTASNKYQSGEIWLVLAILR